MTIIAKLLKDSGFATVAGQFEGGDYLDVFLSTDDATAVLSEHKTGGLKAVDSAVRRFGKLLLSKMGSDAKSYVIDGYWVDKTTQKIAVRITKVGEVEKKADDGGAKEKVNKISENESINNDFISLHDSMVTMRTKPTSGGDADLTEKKTKVREAAGKSAGQGTKKTAEEPMPISMDAPGGESAPIPEMPGENMGVPNAAGDTPGSVEAFEQAEKGFIDYITTNVPVDRAVEIATDIYEQVGSGKGEEKPKSEGSEPKEAPAEEKAEENEESETPAEESKEEGTEKKESLKKSEMVKLDCLRFRRLAFNLKKMKGKKLSAETKDEIDEVIDKAVKGLEENVPLEEATKIMQDAMSGQGGEAAPEAAAPEVAPEGGEAAPANPGSELAFASIKNKLAKNKKTAGGFDIVTDTWSGKPEGKPEQSVEDHDGLAAMPGYKKEPTVEDIVHANEKPKVDKPKDKPDFAQEAAKKAMLAFKAVEHMTATGSIDESQREEEFMRLIKLESAQFKTEIYNIRKISGRAGELVVDGKYADLNTIFES